MNKADRVILTAISEICIAKANKMQSPIHATDMEIHEFTGIPINEVQQSLNNLVRDGMIEWGRTMNRNYFRLKPQKQ